MAFGAGGGVGSGGVRNPRHRGEAGRVPASVGLREPRADVWFLRPRRRGLRNRTSAGSWFSTPGVESPGRLAVSVRSPPRRPGRRRGEPRHERRALKGAASRTSGADPYAGSRATVWCASAGSMCGSAAGWLALRSAFATSTVASALRRSRPSRRLSTCASPRPITRHSAISRRLSAARACPRAAAASRAPEPPQPAHPLPSMIEPQRRARMHGSRRGLRLAAFASRQSPRLPPAGCPRSWGMGASEVCVERPALRAGGRSPGTFVRVGTTGPPIRWSLRRLPSAVRRAR